MTNFSINEYKSVFLNPRRIVEPISWIKHIPFAFFITELLKPKIVAELGVHTGNSFSAFCQAVKNHNVRASCYGIDIFKGDPHSGVYDESVYIDINNYITENYGDSAQVMRMTFDEALEYFSDGSIDLLHIDGYHTYEAVKHDFESWLPKMSDRGVILLHDTQVRRDEFGAWKLWEEIPKLYPSYEFKFGYGLGVLAVGKNVPDEIIKFIDEAREKIFIERLFFTLGSNIEFRTRIQSLEGEVAEIRNAIAQKDERIRELEVSLEDRNQHIQSLEGEVAEVRDTIAQKDDRVRELEVSLEDRNHHIQSLEGEVAEIRDTIAQKDDRVRELEASLEDRNQHIQSLEGEVAEIRNAIAEKDDRVRELEVSLEDRNQHIQSLEGEVAEIRNTIAQKDERIRELEVSLEDRNQHIQSLEGEVAEVRDTIAQKDERIRELEASLEDRNQHIQSLEGEVAEIRDTIAQKDERVREFEMENLRIDTELNSIKSSVTWRTVMKWHLFVEKLMPPMTRRRRRYDLGIIGLRTIADEGCRSFWWKFREHRASKKFVKSKVEAPKLDIISEDFEKKIDLIEKKVSIVIPTKNAGSDFEFTLEKIGNQKGLEETEIVIVDSGSTDETIRLAEKYGARVYSIKPEDFNHGKTRNYGAEKATGDYILFLVQDAIPIGDYWLYNMVKVLESDSQIAAATCRQVTRSDADLFACYTMWHHYRAMEFDKDKIVSANKGNFKRLPGIEKRRLAGIDDVCSCIKKDIFDKFKFKKVDFAEDLDLGIRLIASGYKLGFLHSVGVIHSHNRNSDYFLKRYYVDSKFLAKMFSTTPFIKEQDVDLVLNAILSLYNSLKWSIHALSSKYEKDIEIDSFFFALKENLSKEMQRYAPTEKGEKGLEDLLSEFEKICNIKNPNINFLRENYFSLVDSFHEYLKNVAQSYEVTEMIRSLYNIFAICCGSYLGNLYSYKFDDEKMQHIDVLLTGGV